MDELEKDVTDPSSEEQTVPYSRFKEVNDDLKILKEEVSALKTAESQPGGLTPQQKQELEAKEYLTKMIDERLSANASQREQAEAKEQADFEKELNNVLEINSSVNKEEFMKFLEEEADSYEVSSVKGAMAIFKRLNTTSEEAKKTAKQELSRKPNLPSNDGVGGGTIPDDKGKSFYQIAEEAKKSL